MLLANLTNDSRIANSSGRFQPALKGLNDMEYILIFIACCIFVVNLYVISLFIRNRLLRRNSNRLLLSLALSDMITGLVTVPLLVATTPLRQLGFEKYKLVFIMADVMTVLSASLIILNLCAITGERYIRLCHPMTHVTILTDRRIIIAIVVIWLIAFIYSLFPFAWLHHVFDENATEAMLDMVHSSDAKYSIAGAFIFIIPVFALIGAFSRMFYAIHKLGVSERNTTLTVKQSVQRKREKKAITIFGVMFTVFLVCWAPWIILRPIISEHPKMFMSIPPLLLNILMLIRFLSSVINPLLYTMHKYDFNRVLQEDKRKLVAFLQCREYIDLRRGSLTATGSNYRPYSSKQVVGYSSKDVSTLDRVKDPKASPTEHGQYLQVPNGSHNHSNGSLRRPRAGTREEYLLDSLADQEERRCFNEGDATPVNGINCSCRHPEKLVSKALLLPSCDMGDDCNGRNDDHCDAKNMIHNGNLRRPRAGTREEFLPDSLAEPEERRCFNEHVTPVKGINCSCKHPEKLVSKALLSPSCDIGDACYARDDDQSSNVVAKSRSPSVKRVSFNNITVEHAKQESLESDPLIAKDSTNAEVTSGNMDAETDQKKCVDGNGFSSLKQDVTESGAEHKSQCEGVTGDNSTTKERSPRKSPCLNVNLDSHGIAVQQSVTPRPSIFKTSFLQKIFNTQDRHTIKSNAAKAGSGADELPSGSHETATGSVYSGQSFNSRRPNDIGDIQPRPNGDETKVLLAGDGDHTDEIVTILSKKAENAPSDDDSNQNAPPNQTSKTDPSTKAAVCKKTIGTDDFEVVVKYDSKAFQEINFSAWI